MAIKLVAKKPESKKSPSPAVSVPMAPAAPPVSKAATAHKKVAAAKTPVASKPSKTLASAKHAQNRAETIRVIRDAKAGKNLVRYSSVEAMYEDLGI